MITTLLVLVSLLIGACGGFSLAVFITLKYVKKHIESDFLKDKEIAELKAKIAFTQKSAEPIKL